MLCVSIVDNFSFSKVHKGGDFHDEEIPRQEAVEDDQRHDQVGQCVGGLRQVILLQFVEIYFQLSIDCQLTISPWLSPSCLLGSVQAEHGAVAGQEVGIRTGVGNLNWIGEIEKYLALDDKNIFANLHPTDFAHFPEPDGDYEG